MNKRDILMGTAIIFLGVALIVSSYFGGIANRSGNTAAVAPSAIQKSENPNREVMSLTQAAVYMNMTKEELQGMIVTESDILEKTGSFDGKMLPYFTVDGKKYFYKEELNEWLKEVSSEHREYNLAEGWIL